MSAEKIPFAPIQAPQPIDIAAEVANGEVLIKTLEKVLSFALIGSATYMPDAADVDFAILIDPSENAIDYCIRMEQDGWGCCGEYDGTGGIWMAIRRDNLNFMVSHDPVFFERYKVAMEVCKALRLKHKVDRIAVCQIVRDGKSADEVSTSGRHMGAAGIAPDQPATCRHCNGTGAISDGEITGSGGVEFECGPIQCMKDCPFCQPAERSA